MLNQVILTRCMPARDLTGDGHVLSGADGYGVFTFSGEIIGELSQKDREYLLEKMEMYNGARDGMAPGLFRSYDFVCLPGGGQALIAVDMRSREETAGVTRAGGAVIRPNTFVVHSLAGSFTGYPSQWMDGPVWTAHQKPAADYYMDNIPNPEPPYLPQIEEDEKSGMQEAFSQQIRAFAADGRGEAIARCVAFLLQEYDKPETSRRVLLIRDEPGNVRLWVSAIEQAFSPRLARTIPFGTNRTKLNGNPESVLFEAASGSAASAGGGYSQGPGAQQRPAYMITGIHPQDSFCSGIRANRGSRFVVLDGASLQFEGELETDTGAAYFCAVQEQGEDLKDFCTVVLQALELPGISSDIPVVYDAYLYLLEEKHDKRSWRYEEALRHLQAITRWGVPRDSKIADCLFEEFCQVYPSAMMVKDQENGYALLNLLSRYASFLGREEEVTVLLAGGLASAVDSAAGKDGGDGKGFAAVWKGLSTMEDSVLAPVLSRVVTEETVAKLGSGQNLRRCAPEAVVALSDMLCRAVSVGKKAGIALGAEHIEEFALSAVKALKSQPMALGLVLAKMETLGLSSGALVSGAASQLAEEGASGDNTGLWEALLSGKDADEESICRSLLLSVAGKGAGEQKSAARSAESFLAYALERSGSCTRSMQNAFEEIRRSPGAGAECGKQFFEAWAEMAKVKDYPELIHAVTQARLPVEIQKPVFRTLNGKMDLDTAVQSEGTVITAMDEWGKTMGIISRPGFHAKLRSKLKQCRNEKEVLDVLESFGAFHITENEEYFDSRTFEEFCRICGSWMDGSVHLAALSLFGTSGDRAQKKYREGYVATNLAAAKGRQMAEAMYGFCEAILSEDTVRGKSAQQTQAQQAELEKVFRAQAADYYKGSLFEEAARLKHTDKTVKEYLLKLLEELEQKKKSSGGLLGGLLKNIFGRKGPEES